MRRLILVVIVLILAGATLAALAITPILRRGVSARDEPTWIETVLARQMRHLAVPRDARAQRNPTTLTPAVLDEARAHFADHCATCHGNDGTGRTEMGRGLYPRAPDMRAAATQDLSDGELFAIIEGGIRLTGMPAWGTGTPEGVQQSWHLVHFIRHLPKLTRAEIEEMEALNPKSPAELKQEQDIQQFLQGGETPARPAEHSHGGHDD